VVAPVERPDAAIAAAACGAAIFTIGWRFLAFTGFNNDHYVHLSRAYQMLLGEWPVRDFVDPGMPLMYVVSAAARLLFGPALLTEWGVVAGAYAIGAAFIVVAAARLSGSIVVALLVAVVGVMLNPRSFGYPKILLYAVAGVLIVRAARMPTRGRIVALALMTAVAFLFRHDHGVFIGFGAVATVFIASRDDGWHVAVRRAAVLAAWVAAFLAPWALFVEMHMGVGEYFRSALAFSRGEAVLSALRGLPRIDWSDLDTKRNALSWLFYLFYAIPLACLILVIQRRRRGVEEWPGESAAVSALALMAIPVNLAFLRDSLEGRLPDAFVPAGLLGAWLLGVVATKRRDRLQFARTACAAGVVVLTVGAAALAADVREQLGRMGVLSRPVTVKQVASDMRRRLQKRLPEGNHVPSRYSAALLPFLAHVRRCTSPADRLMMTGLFPEVYVLAERGFAGGHVGFLPEIYTSDDDRAQTIARLERQSVPFVILVNQTAPDLRVRMPDIVTFIEERYRPLFHIAVPGTQGVQVLLDLRGRSYRADPSTGWPCFSA
jgi:hypothetical protein